MKKRLLFTPVFIVTFLATLALLSLFPAHKGFAEGPTYYNFADFYPMTQGSTWTYQWTENGYSGTATLTINGFERVNEVRTAKFFDEDDNYNCKALDPEGLKLYKEFDFEWGYTIYTPPFKQIPAQMYVGQTHKSSSIAKEYDPDGTLEYEAKETTSVTLEGLEDVTVPAGSFTNCLKFSRFDTREPSFGWLRTEGGTFWLARDVGLVKEVTTKRSYDDQGQLVDESTSMDELSAYNISPNDSTLTAPNGGEVLPSGSTYTVRWTAFPGAASYKLKYSMNNGKTWKPIGSEIADTSHGWPVPIPPKNKTECRVKVIGYDALAKKIGADRSDWAFTIEVVKVTYPNGGELLTSGDMPTITWTTHETKKPVEKVVLKYTKNGGKRWKKIETLTENTGTYDWTVPHVPKTKSKCLLKVVLKEGKGNTVASDTSDGYFTIESTP
jgi:hypothetical protein